MSTTTWCTLQRINIWLPSCQITRAFILQFNLEFVKIIGVIGILIDHLSLIKLLDAIVR